jgi:hypothetical protein
MNSPGGSFLFWQRWLVIVNIIGVIVGFLFPFISKVDCIAKGYNQALAEAFFGRTSLHEDVFVYNQWVWAMLGAVIMGWSICMLFIALHPFKNRDQWAWWCLGISLIGTFIVDIGFSVYFNFYTEIIIALAWFIPGIIPIIATHGDFFEKQEIHSFHRKG